LDGTSSRHRKVSPIVGELPQTLERVWGNQVYIPKQDLNPGLQNRLLRLAAFQNPEFYKAQAMRLSTYKPRVVASAEDLPHHIGLPRGCFEDVRKMLNELGVRMVIRDERHGGNPLDVEFHGELRQEQKTAADAILRHETGVLAATTAFGKTVVAAWLIAQRGVNALVLVHRRQLLDQWVERLSTFLDIPARSIGRIGGGRSRPTGRIDVGIIQSLVRKGVVADPVADYGHVIIDECHHLSAHSFEQVARQAKARFVLGLSATVARKDGHHPIIDVNRACSTVCDVQTVYEASLMHSAALSVSTCRITARGIPNEEHAPPRRQWSAEANVSPDRPRAGWRHARPVWPRGSWP
jgi:hypothetical protein